MFILKNLNFYMRRFEGFTATCNDSNKFLEGKTMNLNKSFPLLEELRFSGKMHYFMFNTLLYTKLLEKGERHSDSTHYFKSNKQRTFCYSSIKKPIIPGLTFKTLSFFLFIKEEFQKN